jgi:hypothetical protein
VGGLEENALDVPAAVVVADEVDAGIYPRVAGAEGDFGELDVAPEGVDAESGADLAGAEDGLGAEGGILVDDEVFQGEAGERQQDGRDAGEVDGAADGRADVARDAELKTAEVDERRNEGDEKKCEDEAEDGDEAARAARARGTSAGIGVEIRLVVVGCGVHAGVGSNFADGLF